MSGRGGGGSRGRGLGDGGVRGGGGGRRRKGGQGEAGASHAPSPTTSAVGGARSESGGDLLSSSTTPSCEAALVRDVEKRLVVSSATAAAAQETSVPAPAPPVSSKAIVIPRRPGFGTAGRKCNIRANHFLVNVANNKNICHYDVAITPEVISRGVNRNIINELVKLHRDDSLGGKLPAFDGKKSLYSAGELPFSSKEFNINLMDKQQSNRERAFKVTIKLVGQTSTYNLQEFMKGRQIEMPQEIIQALDVVLRESPSRNCVTFSRSFFSLNYGGNVDIQDGLECWRGFYQSLRPTQMGLSLNIDLSATSFYKSVPVLQFVAEFLHLNDLRQLSQSDLKKVSKVLKGLKVKTTHRGNSFSCHRIKGLTALPLSRLTFPVDDSGKTISVVLYFREKYNCHLRHISLPCLQSGSDSRPTYLPMEVCEIVAGQRYSRKLSDRQVTNILRLTCQRPADRQKHIEEVTKKNAYNTDLYAREFSINVADNVPTVEARVLPAPQLKYHESGAEKVCNPSCGQWNMINKKMVNGGQVDTWTCISFSRAHQNAVGQFCRDLVQMCNNIGMKFNVNPVVNIRTSQPDRIEDALRRIGSELAGKQLQILIVVLPEISGRYGLIKKICETELGFVSQCCLPKHIQRYNGQYLENLALKINVKVGGRNTVLSDALARRIPLLTDAPTIIFGADVTHPPPGEDSTCSIAAVVASMDWPEVTKYRCLVSAQRHRDDIIQDLFKHDGTKAAGMIRELLVAFYKSVNQKPQRIIFYRDGVSEGQFNHVLLHEMDAIRKACASLEVGYLPPVTFVVVQKRHHTRLFPAVHGRGGMTDKSGNILPGTVVDTSICHPTEFDFYLCSHAGIQGTSRPAHYHVLLDENKFAADHLQLLTNNLCYTYARCTRSVSVVPPAYYAHLAAARARHYAASDSSESSSLPGQSTSMPAMVTPLPAIQEYVKSVMFYC